MALAECSNLFSYSFVGMGDYRTKRKEPQPRAFTYKSRDFMLALRRHKVQLPSLPPSVEELDLSCSLAEDISPSLTRCLRQQQSLSANVSLSLRRINLSFCPLIENKDLALLPKFPQLKLVHLDGTGVTDVSPLLDCPKLEYLSIRFAACDSDPSELPEWKEFQEKRLCIIDWEVELDDRKRAATDQDQLEDGGKDNKCARQAKGDEQT